MLDFIRGYLSAGKKGKRTMIKGNPNGSDQGEERPVRPNGAYRPGDTGTYSPRGGGEFVHGDTIERDTDKFLESVLGHCVDNRGISHSLTRDCSWYMKLGSGAILIFGLIWFGYALAMLI